MAERLRARRGSGSVRRRNGRWVAQVSLGVGLDGRRLRPTRNFATREQARDWIEQRQAEATQLDRPIVDDRLAVYLRSWLVEEASKLADGYAPASVNRMRETLRSALATAVRQERLPRNVARYGGGVGAARPPVDRFTDRELAAILTAAEDEHFFRSSCC